MKIAGLQWFSHKKRMFIATSKVIESGRSLGKLCFCLGDALNHIIEVVKSMLAISSDIKGRMGYEKTV